MCRAVLSGDFSNNVEHLRLLLGWAGQLGWDAVMWMRHLGSEESTCQTEGCEEGKEAISISPICDQ